MIAEFVYKKTISPPRPPRTVASVQELKAAALTHQLPELHYKEPKEHSKLELLGKKFFFDPRFSKNGLVSCATCHIPALAFTDGKTTAEGQAATQKNTPTLLNMFQSVWFFYDGRADSLAMQAQGPLENTLEHGMSRLDVVRTLKEFYETEYESFFGPLPPTDPNVKSPPFTTPPAISSEVAAYGLATLGDASTLKSILSEAQSKGIQPIQVLKQTSQNLNQRLDDAFFTNDVNQAFANFGTAIAAFESTIVSQETAFDRFAKRLVLSTTEKEAFTDEFGANAYRGFQIFIGEGNCALCHQGPYFTDQQFHNIGLPIGDGKPVNFGRAQGVLTVLSSPFNCKGPYLKQNTASESCKELHFIETESSELVGAVKTPTLRSIKLTAPYGHDGRFSTMKDILNHYNKLDQPPGIGHREDSLQPLNLSEDDLGALEEFLKSL
jgi:cytochrome c peroxidase